MNSFFLKKQNSKINNNLVIVRAGQRSLHHEFFYDQSNTRSWDRMLFSYVDPLERDLQECDYLIRGGVSKWTDFADLINSNFFEAYHYEYIMVMDDDLLPSEPMSINMLFERAKFFNFEVCQPSLSHDSFHYWPITLNCPAFHARYTNFVECMCPVFSSSAVDLLKVDISIAISGCGLDLIFSEKFNHKQYSIGIIDDVKFKHTKPIDPQGGDFYTHLKEIGVDPNNEVRNFMNKYNLTSKDIKTLGGVSRSQPISINPINQ